MNSRKLIRNYIFENVLFTDDQESLSDDASLLEQGIIDSMGALEIALFIEKQFGFAVGVEEMLPKNLDSVNNLVAFIDRKQKGTARVSYAIPTTAALVAG
jgi:acyl carrier protein